MTYSDLSATEEEIMIAGLAGNFARERLAPFSDQWDEEETFPAEAIKELGELGFMGMLVPEEFGGVGASYRGYSMAVEELAAGNGPVTTIISVQMLVNAILMQAGSEEQREKYLKPLAQGSMLSAFCLSEPQAGSDASALITCAVRRGDNWIINGTKQFISNGSYADINLVFAVTDPQAGHKGLSCFVVDRESPGLSVGKHLDKMGQRCADTAEITFEDVEVPAENLLGGVPGRGFYLAMQVFDRSRPTTASGAVGVAQRALDESIQYARERETFGLPIYQHQAVGHMIADMAINIEAARLLVWRAATMVDQLGRNSKFASYAKAFAADIAMKTTVDAVQVFGGYGFSKEYPVEKLMRDVKVFQIYEGTSQIQRNIIVRELFRE